MTVIQKWFLIIAVWVVIMFLSFTFYWGQVRPVKIRQMCSKRAGNLSKGFNSNLENMLEVNQSIYLECCRKNGLKE